MEKHFIQLLSLPASAAEAYGFMLVSSFMRHTISRNRASDFDGVFSKLMSLKNVPNRFLKKKLFSSNSLLSLYLRNCALDIDDFVHKCYCS